MAIISVLQQIQNELKAPKNQYNSFGKYNYRNCEDILEALKPILAKHSAAVTLTDSIEQIGGRIYVKAVATLSVQSQNSAEERSVSAFAREDEAKKGMDGSQITGSASSYARKYALNGLFAIDDTKDSDNPPPNSQTHREEAQPSVSGNQSKEPQMIAEECNLLIGEVAKRSYTQFSFVKKTALQECGVTGQNISELKKVKQYLQQKLKELNSSSFQGGFQ